MVLVSTIHQHSDTLGAEILLLDRVDDVLTSMTRCNEVIDDDVLLDIDDIAFEDSTTLLVVMRILSLLANAKKGNVQPMRQNERHGCSADSREGNGVETRLKLETFSRLDGAVDCFGKEVRGEDVFEIARLNRHFLAA